MAVCAVPDVASLVKRPKDSAVDSASVTVSVVSVPTTAEPVVEFLVATNIDAPGVPTPVDAVLVVVVETVVL